MRLVKLILVSACLSLGSGFALANYNCHADGSGRVAKTGYENQLSQLQDSLKASYAQALSEYNEAIALAQTIYAGDTQAKELGYQERMAEITKFANNEWRKELHDLVRAYNEANLLDVSAHNESVQGALETYNTRVAKALEKYNLEVEKLSKDNSNAYCE